MPDYLTLKTIHMTAAALSIAGYVVRGVWMLRGSPLLQARWVRVVPHVVDTVLLASAIGLLVVLRLYPWHHAWLMAKLIALVAYIVVGAIGLRYGRTRRIRAVAWVAAIAIFAYIVGVARTHSPTLGWL
jgi:uncharacterized membrane protein SirB2